MFFDRLFEVISQCFDWFIPFVVLKPYEAGVHLRWGKKVRIVRGGFWWTLPFGADHVIHDNTNWRVKSIGLQSLFTKDGQKISLTAVVTARIGETDDDIEKAILSIEDVDHALLDACAGVIGSHVASHTWDQMRTEDTENELSKACRRRAKRFGIEIDCVQLRDFTPAPAIRVLQSPPYQDLDGHG